MTKIGIITCANANQHGQCATTMCLSGIRTGTDQFAQYNESGGAELVGISRCSGCPTAVAPERILEGIRPLYQLGAEKVHLASCMMAICPFKNKYIKVIEAEYPEMEVVAGTHAPPPGYEEQFVEGMRVVMSQKKLTLGDLLKK